MTQAARLARADALTEALRATNDAISNEPPTDQALRIIDAIKRLRDDKPARITSLNPVDYFSKAQYAAHAAWRARWPTEAVGPEHDATGSVSTPLGPLAATVWRQKWTGKRGERVVWAGTYMLNNEPITVAEIRESGLAQRPTTRRRRKKSA